MQTSHTILYRQLVERVVVQILQAFDSLQEAYIERPREDRTQKQGLGFASRVN